MTTDTGLIYDLALRAGDEYAANFARILNSIDADFDADFDDAGFDDGEIDDDYLPEGPHFEAGWLGGL